MTMKAHDTVVLRRPLPDLGLEEGDVGAIVHRHSDDAFEVEFVSGEGATVGVVTLRADDLRPVSAGDMLHVRSLVSG
jgi:hypothetical protein